MLQGKRALVIGVANARSIAWGVADRWRREGAEVFVTYQVRWCGKVGLALVQCKTLTVSFDFAHVGRLPLGLV